MGLTSRTMVRRLRAWNLGAPIGLGQTIHTATAAPKDRLLLAFLKMGGETRPWGVAWKLHGKQMQFRFVPEPRSRDAVDEMLAELGPVLATHLRNPNFLNSKEAGQLEGPGNLEPIRQIWVPNASHLDMLHHIAYSYSRRKPSSPHSAELRLLGRTSMFTFLESRRPGQQIAMSASDAIRSAFDFPAQDVRQAHLGFLLAWLDHRGTRDEGLTAARDAERMPVSTALLPELEIKKLGKLVQAYNTARRDNRVVEMKTQSKNIGALLKPELERRIDLVAHAVEVLTSDPRPVNKGVAELVRESAKAQWWNYVKPEITAIATGKEPWIISAETDFDSGNAAARFYRNDASADRMFAALVHDDRELEAEAIATGRAFRGTIIDVKDIGIGKKTLPIWMIEDATPGPLRMRIGDRVCIVGHKEREAIVRNLAPTKGGGLMVEVEITRRVLGTSEKWPHSMKCVDELWLGLVVTLIGTSFAAMTDKKAHRVKAWDPRVGDWILGNEKPEVMDPIGDGAFVEVPE